MPEYAPGTPSWVELSSPDADASAAFYREVMGALRQAQREMDDRCDAAVAELDEDAFNRLFEAEQAKVDAIRAQIDDVIEHDKWPKHLYFKGV